MRTYDQLDELEKKLAWDECHTNVADLLFNGIVRFQDESLNELLSEAIEKSGGDFEIFYDNSLTDETILGYAIDSMAGDMVMDSEYPSRREDGSYKKVIQL